MIFAAHLVNERMQSSTVKSYVSAIKRILTDDNYKWKDENVLLHTLTKACKVINDKITSDYQSTAVCWNSFYLRYNVRLKGNTI